jgi:gamma-glutamylcyclotransferase (GGCT)/AIG2-like uncharacterized protein YtfP
MPEHLFVYGSLRSESPHPMARKLASQARLIGRGSAQGTLYDLGRYSGAMFGADHKGAVIGEVFELPSNDRLLRDLDAYEGIAEEGAMFTRVEVEANLDTGSKLKAFAYALGRAPHRPRPVANGDWLAHFRMRARPPR